MYNYGGNYGNYSSCGCQMPSYQPYYYYGGYNSSNYAIILVLFILLVIVIGSRVNR